MSEGQPSAFHAMEKAGWERAVKDYDDAFARLTTQSNAPLLEALQLRRGARLLDVACGPGYLTGEAAQRGIQARGIDFSAGMVALAKRRYPKLRFEEGDAEKLNFPDACFDGVALSFILMHVEHPERALAEAARVLKPGGGCAFTVWAAPPQTEAYRIVLGAIEKHGRMDVPLPPALSFFHFSDAAVAKAALQTAGLTEEITIKTVPQQWRFKRTEELFAAMYDGSVRTAALLRGQTPEALAAIRAAIEAGLQEYTTADGFEIPMPAMLASGRKPLPPPEEEDED